jgi:3-oxo-5-alpha-steroid 4-dehydrogenase 3
MYEIPTNTDPVQLCRSFFLFVSAVTFIFSSVPSLKKRFADYGARSTKIGDSDEAEPAPARGPISWLLDFGARFQVPHSWFITFYITSVASSVFWAIQIMRGGPVFAYIASKDMEAGWDEPSMTMHQLGLTWLLMFIQGSRRLYECITLNKPSNAKMSAPAWLLGVAFYAVMGVCVWVEGIRENHRRRLKNLKLTIKATLLTHDISLENFITPKLPLKSLMAIAIFVFGSLVQHDCHQYLFGLKKYTLPDYRYFQKIVCPHYTSELLIYLGIAIGAAPVGEPLNKTIAMALFFEVVNLGVTAESTREWYSKKFGQNSVQGRWRMIPYLY